MSFLVLQNTHLSFPLEPFPKKEARESITKLVAILPEKRKVFVLVAKQLKKGRFKKVSPQIYIEKFGVFCNLTLTKAIK